MNTVYDKCRYEIQEKKEVPMWYILAHFEHWLALIFCNCDTTGLGLGPESSCPDWQVFKMV